MTVMFKAASRLGLMIAVASVGACGWLEGGSADNKGDGPTYTKRIRGAAALSGGAGYHGSYLEGGVGDGYQFAPKNRAAPPVPEKSLAAMKAREKDAKAKGKRLGYNKLPLPTGYPLMPGDEALWPTLNIEQQKRALQYLKDGSTIRSSVRG